MTFSPQRLHNIVILREYEPAILAVNPTDKALTRTFSSDLRSSPVNVASPVVPQMGPRDAINASPNWPPT
jgi:hypothetical protein